MMILPGLTRNEPRITSQIYRATWREAALRLMDKILHDPKDPKLWELRYIPYYGSCRILSISRSISPNRKP